jgi:hypothetical protein
MAEREMARHEPCRKIDLSLAIKGVQQAGVDHLRVCRPVVERLAALARNAGRRHIEIAS